MTDASIARAARKGKLYPDAASAEGFMAFPMYNP